MVPVRREQPPPLRPAGSVPIGPAVSLLENEHGGAVSVWGMVSACWEDANVVGRRLAAVTLVTTRAATQLEVAPAFAVDDATLDARVGEGERRGPATREAPS